MKFKKTIIIIFSFLVACTEEVTHPVVEVQSDSTNTFTNIKAPTTEIGQGLFTISLYYFIHILICNFKRVNGFDISIINSIKIS